MNQWKSKSARRTGRVAPPSPFGLALLLVTFLTLCLFTFAAITLASARNESQAGTENAARRTAYYNACSQAEEKLADLDAEIADDPDSAQDEVSWNQQISSSEHLSITVRAVRDANPHYEVTRWQTVSDENWSSDTTLPVLQMDD